MDAKSTEDRREELLAEQARLQAEVQGPGAPVRLANFPEKGEGGSDHSWANAAEETEAVRTGNGILVDRKGGIGRADVPTPLLACASAGRAFWRAGNLKDVVVELILTEIGW